MPQLDLFPSLRPCRHSPDGTPLLLMACSGRKLEHRAPAIDLYRGVLFDTYRAHVQPDATPAVLILSAQHGFLNATTELAPYDEGMTIARSNAMLEELARYVDAARWPTVIGPGHSGRWRAVSARYAGYRWPTVTGSVGARAGDDGRHRHDAGAVGAVSGSPSGRAPPLASLDRVADAA